MGGTRALKQHDNEKNTNRSTVVRRCKKVFETPEIGTVVEQRYRIDRFLGKGSFGFVCACNDLLAPNLTVAIKFLKYVDNDRKTLKEISILKKISDADKLAAHHCIQPIDLFRDRTSSQDCIVFPMYSCNLYEFLKRNHYVPFSLHESRTIIRQLLQAVRFIHSLDIIHTDLKPENIMLYDDAFDYRFSETAAVGGGGGRRRKYKRLRNLRIKVIDFGMAVEGATHSSHCQTRHYRAPEVILEQRWSFGVDLWSVGCILYELISGETIFMPSTTIEHLSLIEQFLGRFSRSVVDGCSPDIRKLYFHTNGTLRKTDLFRCRIAPLRETRRHGDGFDAAVDLVERLLRCNARRRIGAQDALQHRFLAGQ